MECEKLLFWDKKRETTHHVLLCLPSVLENDALSPSWRNAIRYNVINHYEEAGLKYIDSIDLGAVDEIVKIDPIAEKTDTMEINAKAPGR